MAHAITRAVAGSRAFSVPMLGSVAVDGTAVRLDVRVGGAGTFEGRELVAEDAVAELPGTGAIHVGDVETLDAEITGSGSIDYRGDPEVTQSISGTGTIGPR